MVNQPGVKLKEIIAGYTTQEAFSVDLGLSRINLNRILNEKSIITPDVALRLERILQVPTAKDWLLMQLEYDLEKARKKFNM
jgi:addiction module HigA family antidote